MESCAVASQVQRIKCVVLGGNQESVVTCDRRKHGCRRVLMKQNHFEPFWESCDDRLFWMNVSSILVSCACPAHIRSFCSLMVVGRFFSTNLNPTEFQSVSHSERTGGIIVFVCVCLSCLCCALGVDDSTHHAYERIAVWAKHFVVSWVLWFRKHHAMEQ